MLDLSKLNLDRLKAYRKSILRKVAMYEVCDCGSQGCDHRKEEFKNDANYLNLAAERDRVNMALANRQMESKMLGKQIL